MGRRIYPYARLSRSLRLCLTRLGVFSSVFASSAVGCSDVPVRSLTTDTNRNPRYSIWLRHMVTSDWLCLTRTHEWEIEKDPGTPHLEALKIRCRWICGLLDLVPLRRYHLECSQGRCRALAQFSTVKLSVRDLPTRKLLATKAENRFDVEVLADRPAGECFFAGTSLCVGSNGNSSFNPP